MTHCVGITPSTSGECGMEERTYCRCGQLRSESSGQTHSRHGMEHSHCANYDVTPHHMITPCQPSSGWWHQTSSGNKCYMKSLLHTICYTLCVLLLTAGSVCAQGNIRYSVPEGGESGLFVGDVFEDADLFAKYEGDAMILGQLRFRFLRGEHPNFVINSETGEISTSGTIDRESEVIGCANLDICDIKLDVAVQPVQYFQIIKVTVEILDINDHHPTFSERNVIHAVPESTLPASGLVTLNVQDLDSPKNSIQRFELLPATASNMFRVTSSSQIDGSIEIKLKLQSALDREERGEYHLRIVAYDGGNPAKTSSVDVQLQILDANDNAPTFDSPTYEVSILENIQVPETIVAVKASDPDSGTNGEIIYGFSASTLRNYRDTFSMDENTGEIQLINPVDFEGTSLYTLGVTALDKGPSAISADATVIVSVLDVNDHAPEISISTLAEKGSNNAVVPENSPVGTFVSHFSVTDKDSGDNARVSCYLDSNHFSLEFLYDNEYQMLTLSEFDREEHSQYSVKVICQDNGTPSLTSETIIPVDVSDANDFAPQFEHSIYNAELIENNFEGAVATRVKAIDFDTGINAEVEYTIEDKVKHLFSVDPDTGDVQARVAIDREQVDKFQFEVYATDKGEPRRSAITNVVIHIQDVNDEKPIFNQPNYSFGVFENDKPGTEVGIMLAEDKDSFPFDQFIYRFSYPSDAFILNPDTGRITTQRVLDREEQAVYHLIAEAVDEGSVPGGSSSTVSLSIYIADQNDNYPQFIFPNLVNNTAFVAKDVPYGYIITRLNAIDADIGNNARIVYGIASGNEDQVFDIDFDRGTILVNKDMNNYEDMTFMLNVTATDSGVPEYMVWAMLQITVNGTVVLQPPPTVTTLSLRGNNLVIVIALASTSGVITIILVMAIVCIRCQDRNRHNSNGKYNCRMEALKFINGNRRKKLVDGSTSSGSTTNGSDNGDSINKSKKEVSFSIEMEENGDVTGDKSAKSWCSVIDHQSLQTPRACSSLLTANGTSPVGVHNGNCNVHGNGTLHNHHHPYHENHRGTYAANTTHRNIPNIPTIPANHREIEIQQLLEMLKRDQDSSSLTSGEGSNTDSGRGPSEEGETGSRANTGHDHIYGQGMPHSHLPPVPEDSYSSNIQVVPSSCCDSSLSFMSNQHNMTSFHNTTNGSYLPSEQLRAASRNSQQSQRPFSAASSHPHQSSKGDSTILEISEESADMDNAFYDDKKRSPKLKSILKSTMRSPCFEEATPAAQQGIDNYIKSRMGGKYNRHSNASEHSEHESEIDELKYSCADMSDILQSKTCTDISEFIQSKASSGMDADDDASSATSGSYVVDPKELCDEIDELFFKNMA